MVKNQKGALQILMTDRASVHTGNASEQFLHHNRTLSLVHTVPEQTFETEQKPIRYSANIASVRASKRYLNEKNLTHGRVMATTSKFNPQIFETYFIGTKNITNKIRLLWKDSKYNITDENLHKSFKNEQHLYLQVNIARYTGPKCRRPTLRTHQLITERLWNFREHEIFPRSKIILYST